MKHYNHEIRPLSELKEYEANSRTHSPEQIKQVERSIQTFGFTNPVLIDENNTLIAGHARCMAAANLGLSEVPTIVIEGLSREQKAALVIADNKLAMNAGWNFDALKSELSWLDDAGFDLSLTGFDDLELDEMLEDEPEEGLTDEDDVPEAPPKPISKRGDVWILGNHRLMCGDSTSIDDVDKLLDGHTPKLVHTDPPYGMNAVSKSAVLTKSYGTDIHGDDNPQIAKDCFNLVQGLMPESKQIWWGANYYCSVLPDSECWLVWDKNNGQSDQTDCELAWANFRSVVRQFTQASEKTNRVHPTQKPVSLVEWIFKRFKYDGDTVADFFGGSGSTLIAAEKNNRKCFTMEYDEKFCDVIINRWQNFTGKEAIHESSGKTYKQMSEVQHGSL